VKARYSTWTRACSMALALILGLVLAAPPAMAAEPQPPSPTPARTSLAAAAAAKVEALDTAAAVQPALQEPPSDDTGSPSFFKTPKGIAVLLLFVGGTTAVIVSKSRDRVHSEIR